MPAVSVSLTRDLIAYGRERLARVRIALLWFGMTALAGPDAFSAVVIGLLLLLFRLWDDLADANHDAMAHPTRVLPRSLHRDAFVTVACVTGLLAAGVLAMSRLRMQGELFVSTCAVLGGVYAVLPRTARRVRAALIPLKYPAMVAIGAASWPLAWWQFAGGALLWLGIAAQDLAGEAVKSDPVNEVEGRS